MWPQFTANRTSFPIALPVASAKMEEVVIGAYRSIEVSPILRCSDMLRYAPICSDHHLFHFGRGSRERDVEGCSVGSELRPQAFLVASMRRFSDVDVVLHSN